MSQVRILAPALAASAFLPVDCFCRHSHLKVSGYPRFRFASSSRAPDFFSRRFSLPPPSALRFLCVFINTLQYSCRSYGVALSRERYSSRLSHRNMSAYHISLPEESPGTLTCRVQGFTHPNFDLQRPGEGSEPCFLLQLDTADSGSMPSPISFFSEGNGNSAVSSTPAQHVPLNADIVPRTDLNVAQFASGTNNLVRSYPPRTALPANGSRRIPDAVGPSHSAVPIECFWRNSQQDNTHMANPGSCNGFTREQEFLFSAPLHSVRHKVKKKQERKGFRLPDSLARSFDASEMDKIAQTIVRVNKYGLSTMATGALRSGSSFFKHTTPRVLPSVGAFTVQCAKCFKWRLIPSKEQYEQIRQNILEKPFFCTSWRLGASCDDPPELSEDSKLLWAIDKPNIPRPPDGWERLLVIRGEGCSKFADIYYVSPFGKKLRSMPEVERYLSDNPELVNGGVSLSQFSFASPRSLDENYCRKRSTVRRESISMIPTNTTGVGQPQDEQRFMSFAENAPIAVEPLRAWDPNSHALMLCHHPEGNI